MKKLLIVIISVLIVTAIGTTKVLGESQNGSIIKININGEDKPFRIIGNVGGYTKVMSMYNISNSSFWNSGELQKTSFEDSAYTIKYEGSNVDKILENWYQSLKTGNISLYRAIKSQVIYQYDAMWSNTNSKNGYLTTWLDTTSSFNEYSTSGTTQYILFSNEPSLDTFSKSNEAINRHVYAPCIKDIFEYFGTSRALGANDTNKIFFDKYTSDSSFVWLRDADSESSRSTSAWAVVGPVGGIGTIDGTNSVDVRAEFVVDLNKVIYKDSAGVTHMPIPEGKTLSYTGSEQCGLYGLNDSIIATNYKKSDIGTYTATVSLNGSNIVWSDGTTDSKEISYKITHRYIGIDLDDSGTIEENEKFRELSSDGNKKTVISMFDIATSTKYNDSASRTYVNSNVDNALTTWFNALPNKTKNAMVERNLYQYKAEWTNDATYSGQGYYTTWMNANANTNSQEYNSGNIYQWLLFSKTNIDVNSIETSGDSFNRKVYAPSIKDIFDVYGVDKAMGASDINTMFFGTDTAINKSVWLRDLDSRLTSNLWVVVGSVGGIGTNEYYTTNSVRAMFTIDLSDIYYVDYINEYNSKVVDSGSDGKVTTGVTNNNENIKDVKLNTISETTAQTILAGGESPLAKAALDDGKEVKIFVEVSPCEEYSNFAIKNLNSSNSILLNVDLFATIVGEGTKEQITNTSGKMITVNIVLTPAQAQNIVGDNKNYYILRKHGNEPLEQISASKSIDQETGNYIFTFSTDKFSEYAIYSVNKPKSNNTNYKVVNTITK